MNKEQLYAFFEETHENIKKEDESYVRIMTSNIRHSRCDKQSSETWEERAEIQAAMVLTFLPDFLGLQEVSYQQTPKLCELLSDVYATPNTPLGDFINYPYHGVDYIQNHIPIFYNKLKYEELESRYHLFSMSGLHGYQWARYRSKENPEQCFIHINMHPHSADDQATICFREVRRELEHLRRMYPHTPIFFSGDYNMQYFRDDFKYLFDGMGMETAMLIAEQSDGIECWSHAPGSMDCPKSMTAIDHIAVTTEHVDVKLHRILLDEQLAFSSDHCPMFIDVKIK